MPRDTPDSQLAALVAIGRELRRLDYAFTTVTPATHRLALQRRKGPALDLRDVFGWSRPFAADVVPRTILERLEAAGCSARDGDLLRSTVRFSTLGGRIFAHSAFPTTESDAVFFGPDTHRFVAATQRWAPRAERLVDVGCGGGAGGILLAGRAKQIVLADISPSALLFARVNALLAGVEAEIVQSDVLAGVDGDIDLVIANPPYMHDPTGPTYRDGGGELGEGLAVRIVREALARVRRGGHLVLYTGSPIVGGRDTFLTAVTPALEDVHWVYEELDPDVFGEQLGMPGYVDVERIAAVLLRATVLR
jgi:SAM-dependent methyltransferase